MKKIFHHYKTEYLRYLKASGYSSASIKNYSYMLKVFSGFIKDHSINPHKICTFETLVKYKKYILSYKTKTGKPLKPATIAHYFSRLILFFKYLTAQQYIFINPFDKIEKIKQSKPLPKNIPVPKEIARIMKHVNVSTLYGFRDRAMLELLYSTGIRRKELANITIYDIDLTHGFLRITCGKGNQSRIVPVGKIACEIIEKYIADIRPKLLKPDIPEFALFVSQYGRKISVDSINSILNKQIKRARLKIKYTCHSFRHACATEMLKGSATIRHVQEMLGHKCLSSTQIYTRVLPYDLLKIHQQTHPSWNLFESE